tara:strand:- start:702 stop:911 length:210 start_codon:yes stop_codon:yes gene_type:complete
LDDVQLVAAARTVLGFPQLAGAGIEGEALGIAVAVGPDGFVGSRRVVEGVVGGDAPVVEEAVDLAIGIW